MKIPDTKIAVTLFNIKHTYTDREGFAEALKKIRDIGYEAVQVSGIKGDLQPEEVREELDNAGLYCCATHERMHHYVENFDEVVKKQRILGCDFTAAGHPGMYIEPEYRPGLSTLLDEVGRKLKEEGLIFGYHNHQVEFQKYDGKLLMEEIYMNTAPNHLSAELDLHWIQAGGASPAAWIRKLKDRIHVLHYKDFTIIGKERTIAEIGEGNMDWEDILAASEESTARWYVVEQDRPFQDRDIFDSLKISYDNMRKMGIR